MEKFTWSPKYSVHVDKLDEQHKRFFAICNELYEFTKERSFTRINALLKVTKLGDYMFYHFATEEDLFRDSMYPDIEMHLKSHQYFKETVKDFIDQMRDENIDANEVVNAVAEFAIHWLQNHILEVDQKYSEFIQNDN